MKKTIHMLMVEDDPVFREMVKRMWQRNSNSVPHLHMDWQENMAASRTYLEDHHPDVILLDLGLPDSWGIDTFKNIHQEAMKTPIIVLSGLDDREVALQAVRLGAQDYLVKGEFDANLLSRSILYAIERHELRNSLKQAHDELEIRVAERTADLSSLNKKLTAAEQSSRTAFSELEQVFNAAVALCVINKNRHILRVNREFCRLFAIDADQVVGRKCGEVWAFPLCRTAECPMSGVLAGAPIRAFEVKKEVAGQQIWCSINPAPYRDVGGELIGMVVTIIDISEQKRAEEQARLNREQLLHADKMASLGLLVSGVAHEINNPNSFITLNAPVFKRVWNSLLPIIEEYYREKGDFPIGNLSFPELRKMVPDLLDGMIEGARRINRIVKNLKDFSRKEPAEMQQPVDINRVVDSALTLLDSTIKKATDRFSVTYDDRIPLVRGNAQQIEQVVVNIVINACQALENRNQGIFVSTAFDSDGNHVVLKVQDEGRGIPEGIQKNIFDPFFTTRRDTDGTGLGLSITTNIVRTHQGKITVDSVAGKGSLFTISLPVATDSLAKFIPA